MALLGRWFRSERRSADYTDEVAAALLASASVRVQSTALGAVEAAIGIISRAFASAEVRPAALAEAVTPAWLAGTVREVLATGEAVSVIRGTSGGIQLWRCSNHEVGGTSLDPDAWRYSCDLAAPDGLSSMTLAAAEVVHCQYSSDASQPWRGTGPLQRSDVSAKVASSLEAALQAEMMTPVGRIITVPDGTAQEVKAEITRALIALRGRPLLATTTAAGFGSGMSSSPRRDWIPEAIGPAPDEQALIARKALSADLVAALGVPPEVVFGESSGGTGLREAWRHLLFSTVQPLGKLFEAELSAKLGTAVTLGFESLGASDIAGRARAFASLVNAGMSLSEAAANSGILSTSRGT